MIAMMEQDEFSGPVNLGNPHEMTIVDLAEMIISKTASSSKIVYRPLPVDDPIKRKPSIQLAREKLNWKPMIDVSEGLDQTIDYFRNKY